MGLPPTAAEVRTLLGWGMAHTQICPGRLNTATLRLVIALNLDGGQLTLLFNQVLLADVVALLQLPGITLGHIRALGEFGQLHVTTLRQTLTLVELRQLLKAFNSTLDRQKIGGCLSAPQLCSYLQGELGTRGLLARLLAATSGVQITGPIAALGQDVYSFLLARLTPPVIQPLTPLLNGVPESEMEATADELGRSSEYLSLLRVGTPHASIGGLIQFGPSIVDNARLHRPADRPDPAICSVPIPTPAWRPNHRGPAARRPGRRCVPKPGFAQVALKLTGEGSIHGAAITTAMHLPNIGPALYVQALRLGEMALPKECHELLGFGGRLLTQLVATSAQEAQRLSNILDEPKKQWLIANLTPIQVITYLQGAIGTSGAMGRLVQAANGAEVTGPVGALGQQRYAAALRRLPPPTIFLIQPELGLLQERHQLGGRSPQRVASQSPAVPAALPVDWRPESGRGTGFVTLVNADLQYLTTSLDLYNWMNRYSDSFVRKPEILAGRTSRVAPEFESLPAQGPQVEILTPDQRRALAKALTIGVGAKTEQALHTLIATRLAGQSNNIKNRVIERVGKFGRDFVRDYQYREAGRDRELRG